MVNNLCSLLDAALVRLAIRQCLASYSDSLFSLKTKAPFTFFYNFIQVCKTSMRTNLSFEAPHDGTAKSSVLFGLIVRINDTPLLKQSNIMHDYPLIYVPAFYLSINQAFICL